MSEPTPTQINLMKHAVGFESRNPFYRNRYCTSAGSFEHREWAALAAAGYAEHVPLGSITPDVVFRVSRKGEEYLRTMRPAPTPEHSRPGDRIPGPDDLHPGSLVVWKHVPRGGYGFTVRVPGVVEHVMRASVRVALTLSDGTTRSKVVPRSSLVLTTRVT